MISLVPEMTYRVTTVQPLTPTDGSPAGPTQSWLVSAAELVGPRITATLASSGGDWMRMSPDGFYRPDVRAQFVTDDEQVVLMSYTGLVEQTDALAAAAEDDRETGWDEQRMRLAIRFDTGAERYAWLNESLFVAEGRLLGTGRIEYAVYRVS